MLLTHSSVKYSAVLTLFKLHNAVSSKFHWLTKSEEIMKTINTAFSLSIGFLKVKLSQIHMDITTTRL
jgi:c-di-AMP phosphodiesterase-like protein